VAIGSTARRVGASLVTAMLALSLVAVGATDAPGEQRKKKRKRPYTLTLLHNNDGESQLVNLPGLEDFGGVARFSTKVREEKRQAREGKNRGVIMVSSGDNFLAGPEFNASLEDGVFYDAIALNRIRYDAIALGNHDFDFGPDVLADFIRDFDDPVPYLSANLDFSGEPRLQRLVNRGRIRKFTIVKEDGRRFGIIGATTPLLPDISSPRNVEVNPDVAGVIQNQVRKLDRRGVNKIILISHLQSIQEDLDLATELSGVDIMVAGGGDELLANEGDLLVPGDGTEDAPIFGPYPVMATDSNGNDVPVVTTKGAYGYLGKLTVKFNRNGRVTQINDGSGPLRIAGGDNPDAVADDNFLIENVVQPVVESIAALASNVIAQSEVALDGQRANVRTEETNEGNLIADALKWYAEQVAAEFGAPVPDIALQNGGGIRNDSLVGPGDVTELDTFDMLPFPNFVATVPDVPRETLKELLENAVSNVENVDGRFAQISGFSFVWDPSAQAREVDDDGNVVTPGERIIDVTLDDGTVIVDDGVVVAGDPLNVATIDFSARGGDQWPWEGSGDFFVLGASYQQALESYIIEELAGQITAADYPEGGEGRISTVP
jgi:5'-nucleotidase/UDP-sugar diphosphatase